VSATANRRRSLATRRRALARRPDIDALSDALGIARPIDGRVPVLNARGETVALVTVDRELLDHLLAFAWTMNGKGYAWRGEGRSRVRLHHDVLPITGGLQVDHVGGDLLDARRVALRLVTSAEQSANRVTTNGRSGYRGVYRRGARWRALGRNDGRCVYLGTYDTPELASDAAREWRREHMPGAEPVLPPPAPVWAGTVLYPTPWPAGGPVGAGQLQLSLDAASASALPVMSSYRSVSESSLTTPQRAPRGRIAVAS
jgi:hypothetical protein